MLSYTGARGFMLSVGPYQCVSFTGAIAICGFLYHVYTKIGVYMQGFKPAENR